MSLKALQISIPSTPDETDSKGQVVHPSTPSPNAVDEFDNIAVTSANRSAVVSRLISNHLVTVNDDEIIMSSAPVSLPELETPVQSPYNIYDEFDSDNDDDDNTNIDASITRTPPNFRRITTPRHVPPAHIQHKMLCQSVSSIASPIRAEDFMPQLYVGPEREVLFHTESLGIKISRHTDGYVRVLSVTPYRSAGKDEKVRDGEIYEGDVVREVSGVNLRMPIDSSVWKLTVGLIKMAPRPLKFIVAEEYYLDEDEDDEEATSNNSQQQQSSSSNASRAIKDDRKFGPTREIHFLESCLGVKLHHNPHGYVQILSVTPYKSFPSSPLARTGEIKTGDVVLEVGGVWCLREPIDDTSWGVLIKFIRETKRPLSMLVADGNRLESIITSSEEAHCKDKQEENEEPTTSSSTTSGLPLTPEI